MDFAKAFGGEVILNYIAYVQDSLDEGWRDWGEEWVGGREGELLSSADVASLKK